MNIFSYATFTRKQANVIYTAFKRGELTMTRKQTSAMYDLVGKQRVTEAEAKMRGMFERVIGFVFDGNIEMAQALLDGREVRKVYETITKVYTEQDEADDWFGYIKVGDTYTEKVFVGYEIA